MSATSTCVSASRLVESRVGRELQRYDGATRLLACVVVMRMVDEQAQVLIISSSKHPNEWILPKGGWETDETLVECALREAEEEAGVSRFVCVCGFLATHLCALESLSHVVLLWQIGGEVVEELGAIDFSSKQGKRCRFYGFKVSVRKEFQKWAESNRQRKWVSASWRKGDVEVQRCNI